MLSARIKYLYKWFESIETKKKNTKKMAIDLKRMELKFFYFQLLWNSTDKYEQYLRDKRWCWHIEKTES